MLLLLNIKQFSKIRIICCLVWRNKRKRTPWAPQRQLVRFASTLPVTLLCLTVVGKQKVYSFYTSVIKYIYVKPAKPQVWMIQKPFKKQSVSKVKGIEGKLYINLVPKVVNGTLGWCNWNKILHIWKYWTVQKFKIFVVANVFPDFLCKVLNPTVNTGCQFNHCCDFRLCSYFLLILCGTLRVSELSSLPAVKFCSWRKICVSQSSTLLKNCAYFLIYMNILYTLS